MAKAQRRRQKYPDRYRARVTFAADSTTWVYTTFNTGMNLGARDPFIWAILGVHLYPTNGPATPGILDGGGVLWQLALGAQTARLDLEDNQVVVQAGWSVDVSTNGGMALHWPSKAAIVGAIPTFAAQLTFGMNAKSNDAQYQSQPWTFEIIYVPQAANTADVVEYLAAFGQV